MTNQAKPTAGPYQAIDRRQHGDHGFSIFLWNQYVAHVGDSDGRTDCETNARVIVDALNTCRKTGLTPRQLAEQRAELLEIADAAVRALASDICNLVPDEDLQRWQAAIAKARGGSDAL